MGISAALLPEFDHEMKTTRVLLERVPANKLDWSPHPKSMTLLRLATHVAEIANWCTSILGDDSFDLAPPGSPPPKPSDFKSVSELLARFDQFVRESRDRLGRVSDSDWQRPWSLLHGGQALFTLPKAAVFRTWVLSHMIHHRGQLTVYLRMNDVPLPQIYGPTADEP